MIVERTSEGKAIAKQNPDFKEGRPKLYSKKQIAHELELLEGHSYKHTNPQFYAIDTTEYRGIPVPFVKTGWNTADP